MVRVVDVQDAHTLVVERNGARESLALAGITVTDDARAEELLRWTLRDAWVFTENGLVYRSPDALFINRELVLRGYARATQHGIEPQSNLIVTYLGEVNPAWTSPLSETARRTNSGTYPRSSAPPPPRSRTATPKSGAARSSRASTSH